MIFTSFEYVLFFLFTCLVRNSISDFGREKWFLLIVSYLFYASWSLPCLGLILFTSLVDYYVGLRLGRTEQPRSRKLLLVVSLALNLGVLAFFKYTNFLLSNISAFFAAWVWNVSIPRYNILLPAGISFFTFQSMSYTIDVYRRELRPCESWRDFLLFVAFFPQLVAGPIVRAATFLPQLLERTRGTARDVEVGLALFALGAVKKLVISDQVAPHVELIFRSPGAFDALTLLQGVLGYALQIYCDFSGYSDMAIGSARIMGFRFLDNFRMPYSSLTISEFWRRWHISLSTWLRDYLYIPLGGNRRGTGRTYLNLMLTMLLGGLWHGASWNFVVWGGLHGAALAAHKLWSSWSGSAVDNLSGLPRLLWRSASRLLTLATVLAGWIFFRSQGLSSALGFLGRILTWQTDGVRVPSAQITAALGVVILVHWFVPKDWDWAEEIADRPMPVRILVYSSLLTLLVCLGATDATPFIYFQF